MLLKKQFYFNLSSLENGPTLKNNMLFLLFKKLYSNACFVNYSVNTFCFIWKYCFLKWNKNFINIDVYLYIYVYNNVIISRNCFSLTLSVFIGRTFLTTEIEKAGHFWFTDDQWPWELIYGQIILFCENSCSFDHGKELYFL